jgi:hypothetical protein
MEPPMRGLGGPGEVSEKVESEPSGEEEHDGAKDKDDDASRVKVCAKESRM